MLFVVDYVSNDDIEAFVIEADTYDEAVEEALSTIRANGGTRRDLLNVERIDV